jgi:hypothetical protein
MSAVSRRSANEDPLHLFSNCRSSRSVKNGLAFLLTC